VCLRLPAYSASAKVICFMGAKARRVGLGYFAKSGSLLQSFLNGVNIQCSGTSPSHSTSDFLYAGYA
ncbi:hypothetical protein, partial [Stutzerimonas kunmingensis]